MRGMYNFFTNLLWFACRRWLDSEEGDNALGIYRLD